ncbi:oligopeptide/dipeptide ABC transporter, ATPase subunit [Halosimplex carlsbadense 2-9-1]|uniref:Oligopeptide/dipeptide ABC transporter, ATPase subunit n=1 Tax=Halosimplex carlsbadense 2-9-1 TaxID=797114 RepID=M0CWW7_9EURY|nr:ATP-binding cassette domain-containing protein [Halosimplex carlsbadense]ELZ26932.1 oligopeptide/dipeptide ABC transporter, ATPase subunit [Halosimplex carlsbadense 2-9-1]
MATPPVDAPRDDPDDSVLTVERLSVAYGSDEVLDRLDLSVARGERLAVLGEGASGKTTLARSLVAGLSAPAQVSGSVSYRPVDGDPVSVFDLADDERERFRRETVAVATGDAGGFDSTSTDRGQFQPALRATGTDEARAERLLSALGLDADRVLDARPRQLNAAATQLAALARAALAGPAVLVVDDCRAAVGHLVRGDRLDRFESAVGLGTDTGGADGDGPESPTVVALGAELPALAALADRLAVLHDGHVVEAGPTERLLDEPSHPHTRRLVEFYGGSR